MSAVKRVGVVASRTREERLYTVPASYVEALVATGALPVVLTYTAADTIPAVLDAVDALLLIGGGDVHPDLVGTNPDPLIRRVDAERDHFEFALLRAALRTRLPLLGVCKGAQCLNLAAGGSLVVDLARDVPASIAHDVGIDRPGHRIDVVPGSRLQKAVGVASAPVNSAHHQAVRTPAPGFLVSALAPDGVVEAVEFDGDIFRMGVQWHPEALAVDAAAGRKIFRAFVDAIV